MKLCAAQTKPVKGNIDVNIKEHLRLIQLAVDHSVDVIIFPELSLTGYEPSLAYSLTIDKHDERLTVFQDASNAHNIIIGVGAPTKQEYGTCISMILFHPYNDVQVYSKQYLHADEEPFFVAGSNAITSIQHYPRLALAICYELSVPAHAEAAAANNATAYIVSVAKTAKGVDNAMQRLSAIAKEYNMTVLFSNCLGENDGEVCAGSSAIWNADGLLLAQMNDTLEGIVIFDTATDTTTICYQY